MNDWHLKHAVVYLEPLDESLLPRVKRKLVDNDDCEGEKRKKKQKVNGDDRVTADVTEVVENLEEMNLNPAVEEFHQITDCILDKTADLDFAEIMENEELSALSSSESVLDDLLLDSVVLASEKLKSSGLTNRISCQRLVRLLKILHLCVTVPADLMDVESVETLSDSDSVVVQLIPALNASLTILNIMTSAKMPKVIYMDELVTRIVRTMKFCLQNFMFMQFDPHYHTNKEFVKGHSKSKTNQNDRAATKDPKTMQLYDLLTHVVVLLCELVDIQELTDTCVLEASALAISPFLVENVEELQSTALKLTYKIFSRYEKHQQLILEDILSLLARLPCTTKNVRSYRSSHSEQIQRLTTLVLHLFQSIVKCSKDVFRTKEILTDDAAAELLLSYNKSLNTAKVFLSLFLSKCSARSEEDYRPLFENFVVDLLDIVHRPEWPSVEPILFILSNLLVKQFRTKSADTTARVAALGYLGLIAARLRKEDANSSVNDEIEEVLSQHGLEHLNMSQKISHLQNLLLNYLSTKKSEDENYFCRLFYIAQWCSDCAKSVSSSQTVGETNGLSAEAASGSKGQRARCSNGPVKNTSSHAVNGLSRETVSKVQTVFLELSTKKCPESNEMISSSSATTVARYLASSRHIIQGSSSKAVHSCADVALMQILLIVGETTSALRSKAMKCLSGVIEADSQVLFKREVQDAIHCRCLDQSTSVRDAAVDLLGKSILQNEDLVDHYYGMLSERILDTGISVRKRVISIFRDICLKFPMHSKIPDMCGLMLRRIEDEDGIKKLVTETFEEMWFTPLEQKNVVAIQQRIDNIIGIVAACQWSSISDWMEQLVSNLLKKKEKSSSVILNTCKIIVDGLVRVIPDLAEEFKDGRVPDSSRLIAAFLSLYIFCKLKPRFLVPHCSALHIYLDPEYLSQVDGVVRRYAIQIVELVLPFMLNPDVQLMAQIEDLLMKLILSQGVQIVQHGFSCLTVLIKSVTHNYTKVKSCFQKFFRVLLHYMMEHKASPSSSDLQTNIPLLLRSLFITGLLCEHFDCNELGEASVGLLERIFQTLLYFTHHEAEEVQRKALNAIGHMSVRHPDLMLENSLKVLYIRYLSDASLSVKLCCQVLKNIRMYLDEEEAQMMSADQRWKELHDQISLKEMADIQSGMASTIIQVYLKPILDLFFCVEVEIRLSALNVVTTVLHQGLVLPSQCVPYLICLGSDNESSISRKANHWLKEIHKRDQRFIQAKEVIQGIRMSFQLQLKLKSSSTAAHYSENGCLNSYIYSLLRTNRGYRRVFLSSLLKLFDNSQDTDLKELMYIADCFAGFGFQLQDEALYLIHQLDAIVSVSGSHVLELFSKLLYPDKEERAKRENEDDDDEDLDTIFKLIPEDTTRFRKLYMKSQHYHLLLLLKKFLMTHYGISDKIVQQYSPADGAKMYDKPLNVKNNAMFNPALEVNVLWQDVSRRELAKAYLDFKDLMTTIDSGNEEDENLNQAGTSRVINGLELVDSS